MPFFVMFIIFIFQASHGRTTIIIAHRLSTIQGADVIAAIVNGQLAESGNHQTLLLKKGVYFDLVQAQVIIYLLIYCTCCYGVVMGVVLWWSR